MFKKGKIFIFCMIFVGGDVFCQISTDNADAFTIKNSFKTPPLFGTHKGSGRLKVKSGTFANAETSSRYRLNPVSVETISADFYSKNFGFFCKKELQFEKATKIPLRFRLGSLQYNDYLEGKPNTVHQY